MYDNASAGAKLRVNFPTGPVEYALPVTPRDPFIIGRGNDARLKFDNTPDFSYISNRHFHLIYEDGDYYAIDGAVSGKPSTAGTFVNDVQIHSDRVKLNDGDVIRLGTLDRSITIVFVGPTVAEQKTQLDADIMGGQEPVYDTDMNPVASDVSELSDDDPFSSPQDAPSTVQSQPPAQPVQSAPPASPPYTPPQDASNPSSPSSPSGPYGGQAYPPQPPQPGYAPPQQPQPGYPPQQQGYAPQQQGYAPPPQPGYGAPPPQGYAPSPSQPQPYGQPPYSQPGQPYAYAATQGGAGGAIARVILGTLFGVIAWVIGIGVFTLYVAESNISGSGDEDTLKFLIVGGYAGATFLMGVGLTWFQPTSNKATVLLWVIAAAVIAGVGMYVVEEQYQTYSITYAVDSEAAEGPGGVGVWGYRAAYAAVAAILLSTLNVVSRQGSKERRLTPLLMPVAFVAWIGISFLAATVGTDFFEFLQETFDTQGFSDSRRRANAVLNAVAYGAPYGGGLAFMLSVLLNFGGRKGEQNAAPRMQPPPYGQQPPPGGYYGR